ncbi:hypothetical protein BO83DRAFT_461373 [Aspergillus eucalypticola CBS 122712]|uniref:Uncharacterized protein n=1 Tax=Aspergillus eucalypticola (strain CBS 122712 / IBT 29274) TaxID=1448314 RepID=A0A317W0B7_ASPEC|nr:uncharacterized protein BO83DRAFT_461373 [Aspergillus eucalypticola CBS 122712]PWY79041.1 hypothetical protein BO83DRAFT_461373 [Aspergillus eucalypticola CBS 122712]
MVEGTGLKLVLNKTHLVADLKNGRQYNAYTDDALRRAGDLELPEEKFRHGIKHTSPECRMLYVIQETDYNQTRSKRTEHSPAQLLGYMAIDLRVLSEWNPRA